MPIPSEDLYTSFVVVAPNATIGQVLKQLPEDRRQRAFTFVVLPVEYGRFIVVRWDEVERIVAGLEAENRAPRPAPPRTGASSPGSQPMPPPLERGEEQRAALREELESKMLRRRALELQAARYGIDAPAEVANEINDLRRDITTLQRQLENLAG